MKVRITEGSGWYRNKVGEVFEVVEVSEKWGEGKEYYVDPPGPTRRFILDYECEVVEEEPRILVTKGRWWYEDMVGKEFVVHKSIDEYEDASIDKPEPAYEVLNEDGYPGQYVLARDCKWLGEETPEEATEAADVVEHPSHYTAGKVEVIEIIEQVTSGYSDAYVGYCVGNTQKYIARAPFKHDTPLEDLKKAAKYLEFAIKHLEEQEADANE